MPKYSDFTESELLRYALKRGRTRKPYSVTPSQQLPSFDEALKRATTDDLKDVLAYFIRHPQTKYRALHYRKKAIADELRRRWMSDTLWTNERIIDAARIRSAYLVGGDINRMSVSDEREPLWSDTEIAEIIAGMASKWEAAILYSILRGKRDAYEARIAELEDEARQWREAYEEMLKVADYEDTRITELEQEQIALWHTINTQATYAEELEAQLAQTWQPLPDGAYGASDDIIVAGQHLCMFVDGGDVGDNLPDDIRLCRLVERAEAQPAIPPDVRETLQDALAYLVGKTMLYPHDTKLVNEVKAALAWLDAQ